MQAFAPPDRSAWLANRMEYDFSLSAAVDGGEIVLHAREHPGGDLDWYQFDVGGEKHALKGTKPDISTPTVTLLPTPVAYSGMPASRWWEMEDRAVHMGDLQSGPGDFARLMVAEFATSYSDDWFMVPLRVPRGALVRVTSLKVEDNFGSQFGKQPADIDHVAVVDSRPNPDGKRSSRTFRLFELANDPEPPKGKAPWLFVAPVLGSSMQSPPVERVELTRDGGANLAWAIERLVEGPLGRPMDRGREWFASDRPDLPDPLAGRAGAEGTRRKP